MAEELALNAIEKFTKKKESKNMGRSLSGWYLQQFIKLSAYKTKLNPPLSKQYLVWDSDMILLETQWRYSIRKDAAGPQPGAGAAGADV